LETALIDEAPYPVLDYEARVDVES
jgi:hypothetical protein